MKQGKKENAAIMKLETLKISDKILTEYVMSTVFSSYKVKAHAIMEEKNDKMQQNLKIGKFPYFVSASQPKSIMERNSGKNKNNTKTLSISLVYRTGELIRPSE